MKTLIILTLGMIMTLPASAESFLYIGDSHSHIRQERPLPGNRRFGNVLVEGLRDRGHEVSYYAACGSSPAGWIKGSRTECGYTVLDGNTFISTTKSNFPSVSEIYRAEKHTRILINHGDNMFDWKTVAGKRMASFNKFTFERSIDGFLKLLTGATAETCFWIGPTYHVEGANYRKMNAVVDDFYEHLPAALAGRCSIIDSRTLVVPTVPNDGLHHVNEDSQVWALGVLSFLR